MFKLMRYFKWYEWILALVIVGMTILQVFADLHLIDKMGDIVGLIQSTLKGDRVTKAMLWDEGIEMLITVAISVILVVLETISAAKIASTLAARLRKNVFSKVAQFSMEEINKFSTPSLITRTTNDITQIQQVMTMMLRMMLYAPTMAVCSVVKIIGKSGVLSWTTVAAIGCIVVLLLMMFFFVVPKFNVIQKQTDKLNGVARENLTGLRVVRANSAEQIQEAKFDKVNNDLTKTGLFINRVASIMQPGMSLVMSGLALAIVWISAFIINKNPAFFETMATFTQYAMHVVMSFLVVSMLFIMFPRGQVSANRILEVLNTKPKILDGEVDENVLSLNSKTLGYEMPKGEVEFRNVSFKYPDAEGYVLENISFKAQKGQTVAFIGSTGSGKSTLINLIPRFYDATEGEVLIDGVNVKNYKIETLNNKLGYVPQKGVLFSGSVESNVKYGKDDATEEEVARALKIAQANFVNKLEGGTSYHISQGGKNVSGGQKQRLSISRAVIKNPEIYIFDDSFSALDYKTDKALRAALKKETKDATKLIVAQRIGTIMDADQIIVLDKGKAVGQGTHKQLLKNCKIYKELAYSQLSKEELE